jgi:hypothetical protein
MQAYMYPMLRDDFELVETYQVSWGHVNTVRVIKGLQGTPGVQQL